MNRSGRKFQDTDSLRGVVGAGRGHPDFCALDLSGQYLDDPGEPQASTEASPLPCSPFFSDKCSSPHVTPA